ncbi:MAG: hypothetical protein IH631_05640 [Candidatus Thorarchaeota archaeon]|nr:hypothetical protein [Candidatus Thorarchaeota archaeon]TFH05722.1 MAG: hypothetical protein E4H14_12175 [Candidatus Thorarchaeota archaeon]
MSKFVQITMNGYTGTIARTAKIAGNPKDYFIKGVGDTPIREVLLENWPFSEHDKDSKWYVVDELGNTVTNSPLSSLDSIATVTIEEDTE